MTLVSPRSATGVALVIAGMALAIFGLVVMQGGGDAPYRYELVDGPGSIDDPAAREALARSGVPLREARVVDERNDETLATFSVADGPAGPVLLDWQASVGEPFLTATAPLAEVAALGQALRKHLPANATVLAWWDTSRQLRLLDDIPIRFGRHLVGASLALPAHWQSSRPAIERVEADFWGTPTEPAGGADEFHAWTDALLAPRDEGIRRLREQARGRENHVVVHLRDALLLGAMAPDRIGVAYRDQSETGDMHGSINSARDWVSSEGFVAYSAYRPDASRLRLVALTDEASMQTLIAHLLPFHSPGRQIEAIPGLTLVHQVGGFWVYRIESDLD